MNSIWMPPLVSIAGGDVETWNRLLSFSGEPIALENSDAKLTFAPTAPPHSKALVAEVELRGASAPLLVNFVAFPFEEVCEAELDAADLAMLPTALCEAIHEGMLSLVAELLSMDEPQQWHLARTSRLHEIVSKPIDLQWFEALISQENVELRFIVGAGIRDWLRLAEGVPSGTNPVRRLLSQGISAPADFTIGTITVTHRELVTLVAGSIVVMARRAPETCLVRVGETLNTFVYTDDGWCCTGLEFVPGSELGGARRPSESDDDMADKTMGAQREPLPQGLRIVLVFEIGRRSIPLSELSTWREGALVELNPPALEAGMEVTIRANGDAIGTGDLVMIDDRLAVRITRLVL